MPQSLYLDKSVGLSYMIVMLSPQILAAEMIVHASPGARGTWASGKGTGETFCRLWEAHIIKLRIMLHMTDWQPVTVYLWIRFVHSTMVCRH